MDPKLPQSNVPFVLTFPETQQQIRMVGTPERPEWIAADVCTVLEIANVSYALREFKDTEKGSIVINYTPLLTVTEAGLYRLVLVSRKPSAQAFRRWLCNEVLPSLRKYGCYPAPAVPANPTAMLYRGIADALERQDQLEAEQKQLKTEQTQLAERVDDVAEKVHNMNGDTSYRTLLSYVREKGIAMPLHVARRHGIALANIHELRKIKIGKVPDECFGQVNFYRVDILDEYFSALPPNE